jgi:hypothetical protein
MRWSEIPKPTRRVKGGKTLAERAVEREAVREELSRDYENFQQAGDAAVARRTAEARARCEQRIEEYLKAVEWAAAYERFENMDGWNGDRIEENIN